MPDTIFTHVPGMANAAPVPNLDAAILAEHAFKSGYVANGQPCVIRGAVRHWPALGKWQDRAYLKRICGRGDVYFWPHENHVTKKRIVPGATRMPFADAIDRLNDGGDAIAAIGCNPGTEEMAADLGPFSFFTEGDLGLNYPPFRFIFFRKAGSSWHYHAFDETLMCQVLGTKRIGLLEVDNPHHGAVRDIFFGEDYYEDAAAFDAVAGAGLQWRVAELQPGDALYIPPLWWHGVIVTSEGMGVTTPVCWRSTPEVVADSLKKMAAGQIDLIGMFNVDQFQRLLTLARQLGVERELEIAWKRGVAAQRISLMDSSGKHQPQGRAWPPV